MLGPLHDIEKLKRQHLEEQPLDPKVALLRSWQSQRLTRTYPDLLASPRYRPACEFFLDEIYAPRDFSQRDHDIEQMYEFVRRFVPDAMLRPLAVTVEVHRMTEHLDRQLIDALVNRLGVTDAITAEQYAEAYRLCDNYDERVHQIELIHDIGSRLDGLVRSPLTGATLAVARGPAHAAGYVELTRFLERGYKAFKHMRGAKYFLGTVRKRERTILDRIYASDPDPFGFTQSQTQADDSDRD